MTAAATMILRASRRAAATARRTNLSKADIEWTAASSSRSGRTPPRHHPRLYSTTLPSLSEAVAADDGGGEESSSAPGVDLRKAALQYNNRRAAYKREVSKLRKRYAEEYARKKAADEAALAREKARLTRSRLERQRAKNTRSVINAAREKNKGEERMKEKEREYEIAQRERDIREGQMMKARQLLLDELEDEAPHWMTSPAEVEAKLGNEFASQILWARPGGGIGAPRIGDDFNPFWRYECHHWDMARTYKTPRELLLEELEDISYDEVNVDPRYWTAGRVALAETKEEKAKLRAMVRDEGRRRLLQRQREMMQDMRAKEAARSEREMGLALPQAMPVPHLGVLADVEAQEREGAKVLEEHPEKFFRFEDDDEEGQRSILDASEGQGGVDGDDSNAVMDQTARLLQRGAPVGLRDPLRDPNGGHPYPLVVGRLPEADNRTDAQKKRDERERKMMDAVRKAEEEAQAKKFGDVGGGGGGGVDKDIESAAEMSLEDGRAVIDYDTLGNTPSDFDRKWEEGLDPLDPEDAVALATPGEFRYTDDDIDWVLEKLQSKADTLKEFYEMEKETDRAAMDHDVGLDEPVAAAAPGGSGEDESWMDSATKLEGKDRRGKFVQYDLPEYQPDSASVDDLLEQLDAAQRLVERGGELPSDPASIVPKKPKAAAPVARVPAATRTYPQEDELDRLAKRLNLDDILAELDASDLSDLDAVLDSSPSFADPSSTLNATLEDTLSSFSRSELDALSDLSLSDVGAKLEDAMGQLDPENADDTLDEDKVMDALRGVLPDVEEEKLRKLVAVEMELERNEGVRRAVLGKKRVKQEEESKVEEEDDEGEEFDVVDVDAAEAPTGEVDDNDEEKKP